MSESQKTGKTNGRQAFLFCLNKVYLLQFTSICKEYEKDKLDKIEFAYSLFLFKIFNKRF
ncbi:hypothetical protein D1872_186100 [compost metagenome]